MRLPRSIGVDIDERPKGRVSIWFIALVALASVLSAGRGLRAASPAPREAAPPGPAPSVEAAPGAGGGDEAEVPKLRRVAAAARDARDGS
jgi:hypothetical protein